MLTHLHIENFALIETIDLTFDAGMTVLTGETGAGKSIIIDALDIVLGGRFDNHFLKNPKNKCDLTASFDSEKQEKIIHWLKAHELCQNHELIIRRVITPEGRSKSSINGYPVPLQLTKNLRSLLLTIHGQHGNQALLLTDHQRQRLDAALETPIADKVRSDYLAWRNLQKTFDEKSAEFSQRTATQELLQFQLKELDELNLAEAEVESLDKEQRRLSKSHELIKNTELALQLLNNEDTSVIRLLSQVQHALQVFLSLDNRLENSITLLESALIQSEEAAKELDHFLNTTEADPARLTWVEERLSLIHDLSRKHHVAPNELWKCQQELQQKLHSLSRESQILSELQQQLDSTLALYQAHAKELSQERKRTAKQLSKQVTEFMQKLGMKGGVFEIKLDLLGDETPNVAGFEKTEFWVSTNRGSPLNPLSKVVSGGELSRISLSLDAIARARDATPVIIFDEIDVGIGGAQADIVGQLLRQLSQSGQIFCVTHSAQVAAHAHHHLLIRKTLRDEKAVVIAEGLGTPEKIQELARMLGGTKITKHTLAHARELLES